MPSQSISASDSTSKFNSWGLSSDVISAIESMGFKDPTPVQEACIPHLLKNSGDIVALARTGTGKTAAFGIPLVEKIKNTPELQALVLCPTRELASQVSASLQQMGKDKGLKVVTILGGESYRKQFDALKTNPQILVSTPGRLIDLMDQKVVKLKTVQHLILDEADEMLSFGFQEALESIWEQLEDQDATTWLFSATMSDSIRRLSKKYLNNPFQVALNSAVETSRVKSYAAVVFEEDKLDALCLLLKQDPTFYGIIFAQTKRQVADLELRLRTMGIKVDSLHGDKVQADRTRVIQRMKKKEVTILVATDVAARGLDIEDLTHVVNFEIPWDVETYTHRIGRTARAGKTGIVWNFVKPKEANSLRKFERALKFEFEALKIPSVEETRKSLIKTAIVNLAQSKISDSEKEIFQDVAKSLEIEGVIEMPKSAQEWVFKALKAMKVGTEVTTKQPRSFDLRSSSAPSNSMSSDSRPPRRDYGPRSTAGGRYAGGRSGGGYRRNDRQSDGPSTESPRSEKSFSSGVTRVRDRKPRSANSNDRYASKSSTGSASSSARKDSRPSFRR